MAVMLRAVMRHLASATALALATSALLVACDSKDQAPNSTSDAARESARDAEPSDARTKSPRAKGPPQAIDPATVGTIRGTVHFDGPAPVRKPIKIGASGGCAHEGGDPLSEDAIVNDGRVENAFVSIKDGLDGWIVPPHSGGDAVLDQKGCVYRPHVSGMRIGQTLRILNSDDATHNVNVRPDRNPSMNPIQPPGGAPLEWKPTKRELCVVFECNLHPWMRAYVGVVDHPWFAVSDAQGTFSLAGLPPGEYVVEAWHEKWGQKSQKVTLDAGGSAEVTLTFRPK